MSSNHIVPDNQQSDNEEWRDIVGYEGLYQVSNYGNVRRVVAMGRGKKFPPFGTLKIHIGTSGYPFVALCYPGQKGKSKMIHRLMAFAFLGDPPSPDYQVNHKNGDKKDNRLENLEWVSPKENTWHAINELGKLQSGEHNPGSKLTESEVIEIRRLHSTGKYLNKELALLFSVTHQTISRVVNRELWSHVE